MSLGYSTFMINKKSEEMKKLHSVLILAVMFALWMAGSFAAYAQNENSENPLAVVNGYIVRYGDLEKIKEVLIETRVELEVEEALKVFGDQGKHGAVVITLKNKHISAGGNKVNANALKKLEQLTNSKKEEVKTVVKEPEADRKDADVLAVEVETKKEEEPLFQENFPSEIRNQLQNEFEKSVKDPVITKITVDGKTVTREEALKISVFDVDTATTTYNKDKTDGTLEIKLIVE